jgi:hypothetical protein
MRRPSHTLFVHAVVVFAAVTLLSPMAALAAQPLEHSPVVSKASSNELGALQIALPANTSMQVAAESITPNCTPIPCSECMYLDTHDPAHTTNAPVGSPWVIGPVTSTYYLASDKWYIITISGDVSYWAQDTSNSPNWTSDPSTWTGTPGNPPRYPSPGAMNGYTGFDWEYVFAIPYAKTYPPPDSSFPHHLPVFGTSLNGTTGPYVGFVPVGGLTYHPDHVYKYYVQGIGNRASFQATDTGPTSDNTGQYKICIQTVCGDDGTGDS